MRANLEFEPRCRAELSGRALVGNFAAICAQVPTQAVIPMVKADAYGHGAAWAVRQLAGLDQLYAFGVATLEEGKEVRLALRGAQAKARVMIFSGTAPWSEEKGQFCERHGLTPVISTEPDWVEFLKKGWPEKLSYHLKFNTGMNRLGLPVAFASHVARALSNRPIGWHPEGICSHLAMAEDPDSKLSLSQKERFRSLRSELGTVLASAQFHLANSSAIWNAKHWGLDGVTDIVRPGISLYGVPPWKGAPARGIAPVMRLSAQVVAVNLLKRGETVGYGGTYTVTGAAPESVAILAAGYADGVHRRLSSTGRVRLGGRSERLLGRVSMDLSAAQCTPSVRPGEYADFLGPGIDIWEQSEAAETIPYELLTSVSGRVQKIYA